MEFTGERMIPEHNMDGRIYLEHIVRYVFASQFVKKKTVLDIACGSGYGSDHILKAGAKNVIGVDISKESISYCKDHYRDERLKFLVGGVEKIPLEDQSVDIVVSFETIEHVNESAQINFINEVKRVLVNDGIFIVSTPNSEVFPKGNPFHLRELSRDEFAEALRRAFPNVALYYQDDVESSFVYSSEDLKSNFNYDDGKGITFSKFNVLDKNDCIFLIAVCSKFSESLIIKPSISLTNIITRRIDEIVRQKEKEIIQKKIEIQNKESEIRQKEIEISQKNQEIYFLRSSNYCELKEWKNKIKFALFNPKKFISKYFKFKG